MEKSELKNQLEQCKIKLALALIAKQEAEARFLTLKSILADHHEVLENLSESFSALMRGQAERAREKAALDCLGIVDTISTPETEVVFGGLKAKIQEVFYLNSEEDFMRLIKLPAEEL